ncbi:MAG: hypothetical protein AUG48_03550 [Actinobacteria bacterium 13_1_20CM_3_68_9]|jgi:plastocyanin|nr:MAG: hypothetical protein AUG48_03550 [Actinobacteria bacterium 13_1_20CM_3_68_9]
MTQPRFMAVIAGSVAVLAMIAAGCGSSSNSSTSTGASATQPSGAASGGGQPVSLSADPNGALKFTQTSLAAKTGKVSLQMSNPSSSGIQHGIAVEGNGVDQDGPIVQPGGTSTLSVNLKPGKYEFYCPFDSHKQQGMTGTLTVK